jgi:hypothetical protein
VTVIFADDLVTRLRQRIDVLADRNHELEQELAAARARARRWCNRAHEYRRSRDLWKHRRLADRPERGDHR